MQEVSFGVIGAGRMGKIHSLSIQKIPNSKLVAVVDIVQGAAKKLAEEYKAEAYIGHKELLRRKDIDAVVICTPTNTHRSISVEATEGGKHIYCEKPMAISLREADEMIKTAEKARVKLMIGHQARFSFDKVKKLLDRGVIGDITVIRSYILGWPPAGWMCDPKRGEA